MFHIGLDHLALGLILSKMLCLLQIWDYSGHKISEIATGYCDFWPSKFVATSIAKFVSISRAYLQFKRTILSFEKAGVQWWDSFRLAEFIDHLGIIFWHVCAVIACLPAIVGEANSVDGLIFTVNLKIYSAQDWVYNPCVGLVGIAAAYNSIKFLQGELGHELRITEALEVSAVIKDCSTVSKQLLPFVVRHTRASTS